MNTTGFGKTMRSLALVVGFLLMKSAHAVSWIAENAQINSITVTLPAGPSGNRVKRGIVLPAHIPALCVSLAARRYQVPSMALVAILKQESGGKTGIVSTNKNGSKDYGPAQLNDRSWGRYMQEKYGISLDSLTNNMCQAVMAQAYALRYEWNRCVDRKGKKGGADIWCAIAWYHSPTPAHQEKYVRSVYRHYQDIMERGGF